MKYPTTGRLAAYEHMMQDNGERYGGRNTDGVKTGKDQAVQKDRAAHHDAVKAGDIYARHQS